MKILANLGLALFGVGVFATALAALGIGCVLGVGMAAAASDFQLTNEVATTSDVAMTNDVARNLEPVEPQDGESPFVWSPSATDFAYALDFDSSNTELLPPGSVPVL